MYRSTDLLRSATDVDNSSAKQELYKWVFITKFYKTSCKTYKTKVTIS